MAPTVISTLFSNSSCSCSCVSGESVPFSPEQLRALYRDHDTYVARFDAAVQRAVDAGYVLPREAERLRAEARTADVPPGTVDRAPVNA